MIEETKENKNPANTGKKQGIRGDIATRFKKGQSGNPKGKLKGTISPIQKVKQIFFKNPKLFKEFIEKYIRDPSNRRHIVEMIDGRPKGNLELGVDETISGIKIEIIKPKEENAKGNLQEDKASVEQKQEGSDANSVEQRNEGGSETK